MYCENCGNKIDSSHQFCTICGRLVGTQVKANKKSTAKMTALPNEEWWHRLIRVVYILLYLPLLIIIPLVWDENSYSYSSGETLGEAFGATLITLVVYIAAVRLIKIATIYITFGTKPEWKSEFKRLF